MHSRSVNIDLNSYVICEFSSDFLAVDCTAGIFSLVKAKTVTSVRAIPLHIPVGLLSQQNKVEGGYAVSSWRNAA